jgi:hypothetical protein
MLSTILAHYLFSDAKQGKSSCLAKKFFANPTFSPYAVKLLQLSLFPQDKFCERYKER